MPRPAALLRLEAPRLHRRLVGRQLRRRHLGERDATALALRPRPCAVRDDGEEPRLQRGATFEAREAMEERDPRLLRDLLRDRWVAYVQHRAALQRLVVTADELFECRF